jgi:hypothetical protein
VIFGMLAQLSNHSAKSHPRSMSISNIYVQSASFTNSNMGMYNFQLLSVFFLSFFLSLFICYQIYQKLDPISQFPFVGIWNIFKNELSLHFSTVGTDMQTQGRQVPYE